MPLTLEARAPRARCEECGSPDIKVLCHHCGRGLCDTHVPRALDRAGKALSAEFAGLGLERSGVYHCPNCEHMVRHGLVQVIVVGMALAAVGFLTMFVNAVLGLLVLLAGSALAAINYLAHRRRQRLATAVRPPLAVLPSVNLLEVHEVLHGTLVLDEDGQYNSSVRPVAGSIRIDMSSSRPDWDRLDLYRKRFCLDPAGEIYFSAGFALLRGQVRTRFHGEGFYRTIIPLVGTVRGHPLFTPTGTQGPGQWSTAWDYDLGADHRVGQVPVWLTPSLVPGQDQRSLDLDLQWTKFGAGKAGLEIDRIEQLRVGVPVSWGNIEWPSKSVVAAIEDDTDDPNETVRMIECNRLTLTAEERHDRRVCLTIRFENRIELTDSIRGDFDVWFKGGLSGVTDVDIHHPLGERRKLRDIERSVRTAVRVRFRLNLRGIRYQNLRMVPDLTLEEDQGKPESFRFDGVIPDHETVIDLTNELSKARYYVKRVIENPPTSGAQANMLNRYWDIAGRRYDGVYPVDFHLVLTGEELHDGGIRARTGNTNIRISVQGAFTSRPDSRRNGHTDLADKIVQVWQHLCDTTITTMQRRAQHTRVLTVDPVDQNSLAAGEHIERIAVLHARLDAADEAVIQGRISDSTYQSIREDVERELRDLSGA